MGDIVSVDLRSQTAIKMLLDEGKITAVDAAKFAKMPLADLLKVTDVAERMAQLTDFKITSAIPALVNGSDRPNALQLLDGVGVDVKSVLGKTSCDSTVLYFRPIITAGDEKLLRSGNRLDANKEAIVNYQFKYNGIDKVGNKLTMTATDYTKAPGTVFFGDRPLSDPGYSAFTLTGDVKVGSTNTLDVYRVEQRLAYLGYSAFGVNGGAKHKLKELKVDGKVPKVVGNVPTDLQSALQAFYGATHYTRYYHIGGDTKSGVNGFGTTKNNPVADLVAPSSDNLSWLNAYNAPHLMNIYQEFNIGSPKNPYFLNGEPSIEHYSTSWTGDLLQAWVNSKANNTQMLTTGKLQINGLTDPTRVADLGSGNHNNHAGHSIGMGLDLGVRQQYISKPFQNDPNKTGILHPPITGNGYWSIDNAIAGANQLTNVKKNNQHDALLNFLSIYSLTQTDGSITNGTWTGLPIQNGAAVRTALFGSGVQNGQQLIQNVWIGGKGSHQNPYKGINAVLDTLGFHNVLRNGTTNYNDSSNMILHHGVMKDHQTHFHIDLRPPVLQPIVQPPQHLLADSIPTKRTAPAANLSLVRNAQALLDQVKSDLNLTQGEVTMLTMNIPNVPPQNVPVMIAQANQAQSSTALTIRTIGICDGLANGADSAPSGENVVDPIVEAQGLFAAIRASNDHRPGNCHHTATAQARHLAHDHRSRCGHCCAGDGKL